MAAAGVASAFRFPRLSRCVVWALGAVAVAMSVDCATQRGARSTAPARPDVAPKAPPPAPAITQESDPDNVERRFGFGEARLRRENAAATAQNGAPASTPVVQPTLIAEPSAPSPAAPAINPGTTATNTTNAAPADRKITPARATKKPAKASPPAR